MKFLADGKKQIVVSMVCATSTQLFVFIGDILGFNYINVFIVAYVTVVMIGYSLLCLLHETNKSFIGLFKYFCGMSMNFPVSIVVMYVAVDILGLHPLYGSLSGMALLFAYNYQIGKWSIR